MLVSLLTGVANLSMCTTLPVVIFTSVDHKQNSCAHSNQCLLSTLADITNSVESELTERLQTVHYKTFSCV